jgi:hypothetical protein
VLREKGKALELNVEALKISNQDAGEAASPHLGSALLGKADKPKQP